MRVAWNKGLKLKPLSGEHKKKLSNSLRGKNRGSSNGMYGKTPWNKNKKGLQKAWNRDKGHHLDSAGYVQLTRFGRRIREHVYNWLIHNNLEKLPKGHVVHHINEIRTDNRIENLRLMTIGDHMRLHNTRRIKSQ